ncbi:daunorubicin resistance protein DrrA family ABC transporter ATP-binding protein [soil metagenome]
MSIAIEARQLRRTFNRSRGIFRRGEELVAVDDVNLSIPQGTIFGLLGHNGAGKTTTIKMLSTLLIPTSGTATVAGFDVVEDEREVRRRLGVVLGGDRGLYNKLTARDNLIYFGHLYSVPWSEVSRRADENLDLVGLADRARDRVEGFSRGMKQRLHLAKALVHDPPVLFLDEPTIGLDPAAAVRVREIIAGLAPERTVLLTTHYLHEADALCDRIAIIDQGRIIVEDTPEGIKAQVGGDRRHLISVRGRLNGWTGELLENLPGVSSVEMTPASAGVTTISLVATGNGGSIDAALRALHQEEVQVDAVRTSDLTLEDAFLALTGGRER